MKELMNYCNKCGACCRNIAIDFNNKILYRDGIQILEEDFAKNLTITGTKENISLCTCKFLKGNECTNSEKPEICKNYPSSPFAFLQDDCGYSGYIFCLKENVMQKIRKYKEEIIHYTALLETINSKTEKQQYEKLIKSHNSKIAKYHQYGSFDW